MLLKQIPEDFVVKEVLGKEPKNRGNFVWFSVKKKNWDTLKLISVLARKLGVSRRKIGYAGLKDQRAVTYQKFSVLGLPIKTIEDVKIKDVEFFDFSYNTEPVKLGDLKGNWFRISVRGLDKYSDQKIKKRVEEIRKTGIVNSFDSQRFGWRGVTHLVGKEILKGDFKEAVLIYLTKAGEEQNDARKARERLASEGDFKGALKYFPRFLKWELSILNHLANNPDDYVGAVNILPKTLQLMFIHGFQSYLWNLIAKKCFDERLKPKQISMIGFKTKLGSSELDKLIKEILKKEKINPKDFKIEKLPRLSCEGSSRDFLIFPKNLNWKIEKDELNKEKIKIIFEFEIQKGSYGTLVVKEILENL